MVILGILKRACVFGYNNVQVCITCSSSVIILISFSFQIILGTKQTWPNKWDNMVSGGLSVGYGIRETAIKEAAEEASIPESLAQKIVSHLDLILYYLKMNDMCVLHIRFQLGA